jgi:aminobenzoyl-glutamate utilization protein B
LAPNVIPDLAEVYYYVRNPRREKVQEIFNWVVKAAEGAAMGTETSVTYEVMHGNYSKLPNNTLQKVMHKNLLARGGIQYSKQENEYAKAYLQNHGFSWQQDWRSGRNCLPLNQAIHMVQQMLET